MKISFKSLIGLGLFTLGLLFVSNYNNSFININKADAAPGSCITDSGKAGILDSNGVCNVSYTITTSGSNGTFKPKSLNITSGSVATFTLTPDPGYYLSSVAPSANGCGSGTLAGIKYRTGSILSDCTITASFKIDYPKISSFSASPNPVTKGGTSQLSWNSTGSTRCDLTGPGIDTGNSKSATYMSGGVGLSSTYGISNIQNPQNLTLTCTNGSSISSSNTAQACYTGLWAVGDIKHPGGGSVGYYTNNSGLAITKTDIYINDFVIINYIKNTSLVETGVRSISCSGPNTIKCDPILNCCHQDAGGGWVYGSPCA